MALEACFWLQQLLPAGDGGGDYAAAVGYTHSAPEVGGGLGAASLDKTRGVTGFIDVARAGFIDKQMLPAGIVEGLVVGDDDVEIGSVLRK